MTATLNSPTESPPKRGKPVLSGQRPHSVHIAVYIGIITPLVALVASVPFAWGWGLTWTDVALFASFYVLTGLGITVGYHRHFTHGAFRARRGLRMALALAGSMAIQGPVITWVADHRRHHAFSDREGDPHSPWLFGTSLWALAKGFWHAHMGWMFKRDVSNPERFAPDLLKDKVLRKIDDLFWLWTLVTLAVPAVIGGLITWSWWGALTGFFWAGLVRVCLLHHVTWAVNSVCHMLGERPFRARDNSANFWPMALISFGESWHNTHHADPTSARHGAQRGQLDISARVIWLFEKLGWAYQVRWPTSARLKKLAARGS